MSDQNTNGTHTQEENGRESKYKVWETADEANANKPEEDGVKLFVIERPSGNLAYVWHKWSQDALRTVARQDGYKLVPLRMTPRDRVKNALGTMSDEEKVALLAEMGIKVQAPRKPKAKKDDSAE